jgi:hypothetical protein
MEEVEDSEDKEDDAGAEKQSKGIDDNVFRVLFSSSTNIRNMLGDQQFSKWRDIVNQDINNGKYTNAKYEDGLVYFIGNVNENSVDDRGDDWDVMKYRSRDERLKYDEQIKSMDPKVWQQIGKIVYALGATLGDSSKEYHDALNKINQDIYSGRYETAEYVAVRNEGEESEEGVIVFHEAVGGENSQEEPANKPEESFSPSVLKIEDSLVEIPFSDLNQFQGQIDHFSQEDFRLDILSSEPLNKPSVKFSPHS